MAHLEEEYSDLKEPLAYIDSHLEKLKEIKMENKIFNIQYFFCSDWKFKTAALGLYAASSKHPCIWCTAEKGDFWDIKKNFSITDPKFNARTKTEHSRVISEKKTKENLG